jgi:triosephosphate isomerase
VNGTDTLNLYQHLNQITVSRKKIVAGNWKMNPASTGEAEQLISGIMAFFGKNNPHFLKKETDVIIAPPFSFLAQAVELAKGQIKIAAQNCSSEEKGAFTGEISAAMLASVGVSHVILGHSERRKYFAESNALISKKIAQSWSNKLAVIYCVGETLEERNSGKQFDVVRLQLEEGLPAGSVTPAVLGVGLLVIAYEPVWAIGTGQNAAPEQAQEMHRFIRSLLPGDSGKSISVIYGGSCNSKNAAEIFAQPDVDGGLIGGASLHAEEFMKIISSV